MDQKSQTVNVKLGEKLAKRGGGLVDPESGIAISFRKTEGPAGLSVPKTAFIAKHLHSGNLLEVKPAVQHPKDADEVEVTFKKKVEHAGKEYKAGDKAKVSSVLATNLRDEGKVV